MFMKIQLFLISAKTCHINIKRKQRKRNYFQIEKLILCRGPLIYLLLPYLVFLSFNYSVYLMKAGVILLPMKVIPETRREH